MFFEVMNAKVFRRNTAFAIAVVVTSRSSSLKYTIPVHAVHAGAERNMCNIVVSTDLRLCWLHISLCWKSHALAHILTLRMRMEGIGSFGTW